jgi:uncharacterized protein
VPLLVQQSASDQLRRVAESDPAVVTWWATPVECASAIARLQRQRQLSPAGAAAAITRLRSSVSVWTELWPSDDVREQAIRLVRVHPLRSADALQLAAAIVAADYQPSSLEFVTLDERQAEAAEKEGFRIAG